MNEESIGLAIIHRNDLCRREEKNKRHTAISVGQEHTTAGNVVGLKQKKNCLLAISKNNLRYHQFSPHFPLNLLAK